MSAWLSDIRFLKHSHLYRPFGPKMNTHIQIFHIIINLDSDMNSVRMTFWRPLVNRLSPTTNRTLFCLWWTSKEFLTLKQYWHSYRSLKWVQVYFCYVQKCGTFLKDFSWQQVSFSQKSVFQENFKINKPKSVMLQHFSLLGKWIKANI